MGQSDSREGSFNGNSIPTDEDGGHAASGSLCNPFDGSPNRINFPHWSDAWVATSFRDEDVRRPSIETLSRIYPVEIRVPSNGMEMTNESEYGKLDAMNTSFFHQLCLRKAIKGDSPTPSIVLTLPGIPFRDLPPPLQPQPSSTTCYGSERDDLSEEDEIIESNLDVQDDQLQEHQVDEVEHPIAVEQQLLSQTSCDPPNDPGTDSRNLLKTTEYPTLSPSLHPSPSSPTPAILSSLGSPALLHHLPSSPPHIPPPSLPAFISASPPPHPPPPPQPHPQTLTSQWTPDQTKNDPKEAVQIRRSPLQGIRVKPRLSSPSAWRIQMRSRPKRAAPSILDYNIQPMRTSEAGSLGSFYHSAASSQGGGSVTSSLAMNLEPGPHQAPDTAPPPVMESTTSLDPLTSSVIRSSMLNMQARETKTGRLVAIGEGLQPIQLQLDASGVRELLQTCVHSMATIALQSSTKGREEQSRKEHLTSSVAVQTSSPPREIGIQTEIVQSMSESQLSIDEGEEEKENIQSHPTERYPRYARFPASKIKAFDTDQTLQPLTTLLQEPPAKQHPLVSSIQQYLSQPLRDRRQSQNNQFDESLLQNPQPPFGLLSSLPPPSIWERQVAQRAVMGKSSISRWAPTSFPSHPPASQHTFSIPLSLIPPRLQALIQLSEESEDEHMASPLPASYGASNEQYSKLDELSLL